MKYFFTTILLAIVAAPALAQPLQGSSNEEQLQIAADSARANKNWYVALENYDKLYEANEDETLLPVIALMNFRLRDVKAAVRTYKQVFRRAEATDTTFNDHRFYYAKALKMDEQPDEARTYFEDYLRHATDEYFRNWAELELKGISEFRDAPTETNEVALENLGKKVNGHFSEYSPVQANDGTLYFSTWESRDPVPEGTEDDKGGFSKILMAKKEGDDWGKPTTLGEEVNRPGVHTANPTLSADQRLLFYNRMDLMAHRILASKLYVSAQEDDGWKSGNPAAGINADGRLILQPAMGELFGREVLFFVSDMDGGEGGMDIYYADHEGDGRFGEPVNLGPEINTPYDETTPFYFDGTLYFSSDGYPTRGGKDLFYSAWNGSEWGEVTNMGPGFNSTLDDRSLSVYGDGLTGYMTSNREGGRSVKSKTCCDDIYGFQVASLYANLVVGLFSEGKEALTQGTIVLTPIRNGNELSVGNTKTRDDGNRFDFGLDLETEYRVVASHPGYFPDSVEVNTLGLEESKDIQQLFFLKKMPEPKPKEEVTVDVEEGDNTAIVLENILYDFNDDKILPAAEGDLRIVQQLMEDNPDLVIEMRSHTDTRGGDNFNLGLSKRRAASARRWLITQAGISGPRIKTSGMGETEQVVVSERLASRVDFLNEGDVLNDAFINALPTEEQREFAHQLNRRTDFVILSGVPEGGLKVRIDGLERELELPDRQANPGMGSVTPAKSTPMGSADSPRVSTAKRAQDPVKPNRFSSLFGQTKLEGKPILKFDRREVDLGLVPHGESRSFTVNFVNRGTGPAQIMLIQACDCTTVEHDNRTVYQPGEGGTLKVTFDSTKKEEDETITIDIFLEQNDSRDTPILEMVEYSYRLKK